VQEYLLRVEVVEVVLDELYSGSEVGLVELVRYVPADRSELASLLDGRVKEGDRVEQRLPLRHGHDVDEILADDAIRSLQSGLHAVRRLRRVLDRRLHNHTRPASYGVVCLILGLAILVEHRLVTNRRMNGQTDGHTMTASTALA